MPNEMHHARKNGSTNVSIKPHNMNTNAHSDLQEHCEALLPYSTQRGVAKFVDSAQLNP
jgi:hypothetical protein